MDVFATARYGLMVAASKAQDAAIQAVFQNIRAQNQVQEARLAAEVREMSGHMTAVRAPHRWQALSRPQPV